MFNIAPHIELIGAGIMYGYPLYSTVKILKENRSDGIESTKWLLYWMIFTVYSMLHTLILGFIAPYIPLFAEIEVIFFVWLIHPSFLGAVYLWELLEPIYPEINKKIFDFLAAKGLAPGAPAQKKFDAAQKEKDEPPEPPAELEAEIVPEPEDN